MNRRGMARSKRIQIPGLIRHVMARGNGRMSIFLDDVDYRQFVYLLGDVVESLEIECLNYCVMPNHYHATLRPTLPNLSEGVRLINSRYAQWWNRRHERVGHVFQGRFKDQIVQQEGYLQALCRYIALNPVRAGLVDSPDNWEWSSYAATTGLRPVAVVSSSRVIAAPIRTRRARNTASAIHGSCTRQRTRRAEHRGSSTVKRTDSRR